MRYAVFSDIHANLEALEAVLAKIDELTQEEPIDQIWFLGDLVGYGPDPNECIVKLRERTDVIIAGNHDWAAVGKIDLEDFSEAARISAEWTAEQLTEEHREFLINLPEHLQIDECTLVHGSPYGPLWEYLTSEVLAERSFQYFTTRYCFVGHTHVPIIFQQPDTLSNAPTVPLTATEPHIPAIPPSQEENHATNSTDHDDITPEMVAVVPAMQTTQAAEENAPSAAEPSSTSQADEHPSAASSDTEDEQDSAGEEDAATETPHDEEPADATASQDNSEEDEAGASPEDTSQAASEEEGEEAEKTPEAVIMSAEDRLNQEIEELLALLGLSQSMVQVTNEMIIPPEGNWQAPDGYRAIINPGGVGQPRDGDPRAAFMIFDTERGLTFYRIPYDIEKTQEKIIEAGLPQYLATRLTYGR